jgi:putative GTP pyrophosphokinase
MADYGVELIEKKLKEELLNELNRAALLFRLHSRIKDNLSINEKIGRKGYSPDRKLMQDLIGFRITTYFNDDVKIAIEICKKLFIHVELVYDEPDIEVFKPLRKNMVCKLPDEQLEIFNALRHSKHDYDYLDSTFEIQFRTTLSEGWHEVDHNLRYKCKDDWNELKNESRMLNGIYASLETSDQTLKALFEDISYQHFKSKRWQALIRNKFRLRFLSHPLKDEIITILNNDENIGKNLFKMNRERIIYSYLNSNLSFPMTFDGLIFFINFFFIKNQDLLSITPEILLDEFRLCK